MFTFLLSSQFYWHMHLKPTVLFRPCQGSLNRAQASAGVRAGMSPICRVIAHWDCVIPDGTWVPAALTQRCITIMLTAMPRLLTYLLTCMIWTDLNQSTQLYEAFICHVSTPRPTLYVTGYRHCNETMRFYHAMLCIRGTSHGPVSVRLSVRHKSEFY